MKNIALVLGIIIALIVGGGAGYSFGKSANDNGAQAKELKDSIAMMKEQSTKIQKMGEMMKSGGIMLQEMGMKYNDDGAVAKGKDMEAFGEKYMGENKKASEASGSMKQIMQ